MRTTVGCVRVLWWMGWVLLGLASIGVGATTQVDLSGAKPIDEVRVAQRDGALRITWPIEQSKTGVMDLSLDTDRPLIASLAIGADADHAMTILRDVQPCGVLTVGTRDLKPAGWIIFFDNPGKRPWDAYPLTIGRASARVISEQGRVSVVFDGASAGPFSGEFRFTFYPGGALVRASATLTTQRDASAILFDHGLIASPQSKSWKNVAWTDLSDELVRRGMSEVVNTDAAPVQVRSRTIIAEGEQGGSVALVPPPHQFFYPLDFVDNLASAWCGRSYRDKVDGAGFGVRQTLDGDRRWVPWMNAPPGSRQDLGVFYLISDGDASAATKEALAYTHNDTFVSLEGRQTFSSHYHVEHVMDLLTQQKQQGTTDIPVGLQKPVFTERFRAMGVKAVHLAEFHLGEGDMNKTADRLTRLYTLHAECARLSDDRFLLMPGEEPNVHLGGHWLSFFPKPVYWTLDRKKDQPFVEDDAKLGKVYHVGNAADVLKLMEAENGLMWTAHPRIKGSTGFPDVYRSSDYFKSDHYLGGAWKAMPADCSLPRLGTRVLELLDDMNNWGAHKQAPGEVDVFKIDAKSELYAHMNVNYLKLDRLPKFSDGWQPILDTLRGGRFFTTTGEVLIPTFTIDGKESGDTLAKPTTASTVRASLRWTFPLTFAEVVSGDGEHVYRQRIDLGDTRAFGQRDVEVPIDLRGRTWARFEVWDIAANGAYTQPIWIER
ncbi:MAG: hypothetical protein QM770_13505 [Tepidisphaeraceae bacterium]